MNTFLPFPDFEQCAQCLDPNRITFQRNHVLILLRSHAGIYELKGKEQKCGFDQHSVGRFWKNCELNLARYGLAITNEAVKRTDLARIDAYESIKNVRNGYVQLVEFLEDNDFPDNYPIWFGDEEFHSAMRAYLLFRDMQMTTFKLWKKGQYPDHITTRGLPPNKASWKRDYYFRIWDVFGRPEPLWYGQFGWEEEPDDMLMFYDEDRRPNMDRELERKILRPA